MRTLFSATVLLVASSLPVSGQIMEMNGSWELNPHKSIGPSPAQETLVFDISKGIQRYTMTARNEDGSNSLNQWEIQYDGKDHPTRTPGNTASVRRLGEKTEFVVNKRSGDMGTPSSKNHRGKQIANLGGAHTKTCRDCGSQ